MFQDKSNININNISLNELLDIINYSNKSKIDLDELLLFIKLWFPNIYNKIIESN